MTDIRFTFPGVFDASQYAELIADPALSSLVYRRFMYQMGSIGRTGAISVTTKFEHNDTNYEVHVLNPDRLDEI